MAAYTLPEGFTDFDMFTFGTALLVGGKWAPEEMFVQRLKYLITLEVFGLGRTSCINIAKDKSSV